MFLCSLNRLTSISWQIFSTILTTNSLAAWCELKRDTLLEFVRLSRRRGFQKLTGKIHRMWGGYRSPRRWCSLHKVSARPAISERSLTCRLSPLTRQANLMCVGVLRTKCFFYFFFLSNNKLKNIFIC
jgi:hypothetical protein